MGKAINHLGYDYLWLKDVVLNKGVKEEELLHVFYLHK